MFDRLEELINDPNLVDQNGLNLCGPAAFLRIWLARGPLAVAKFACDLYFTGKAEIIGYVVSRGATFSSLRITITLRPETTTS